MISQEKQLRKDNRETKRRFALIKFLIIVLPLWLSAKMFRGPYMEFIRNYFSAIVLIILLALIVQLIAPRKTAKPVLVLLFIFLSAIEISYLYAPGIFSGLSFSINTAPIIGGSFSINMIPYYGVGAFIGYFILQACRIR